MTRSLKDARVLITPTSYAKFDPSLRTRIEETIGYVLYNTHGRPLTAYELRQLIPDIDGYIAGLDEIDKSVIEAAEHLKVISRYGVGVDNIDLTVAREKGITVTNTPGANSASVAELAVAMMISLARSIPKANEATKSGEWPRLSGITLENKVIGLLGFGSIAKHLARRLQGFNCQILAYDPAPDIEHATDLDVELRSQDEVIQQADFLSLHLPLTPETQGLVDGAFLAQLKPGAFFINTARGELVKEMALVDALERGHIAGAALDVFPKQPPAADNPLFSFPQVIVTPHMGAHTDGAMNSMGWTAMRDCLAVLRGEEPEYRVL